MPSRVKTTKFRYNWEKIARKVFETLVYNVFKSINGPKNSTSYGAPHIHTYTCLFVCLYPLVAGHKTDTQTAC